MLETGAVDLYPGSIRLANIREATVYATCLPRHVAMFIDDRTRLFSRTQQAAIEILAKTAAVTRDSNDMKSTELEQFLAYIDELSVPQAQCAKEAHDKSRFVEELPANVREREERLSETSKCVRYHE